MISACQIEIYLYEVNNLKDKRRIIKSIIEKNKSKYNVSIAETDFNEKWNRSIITFVTVSNSYTYSKKIINSILRRIEGDSRIEVIKTDYYDY